MGKGAVGQRPRHLGDETFQGRKCRVVTEDGAERLGEHG